MLEIDKIEVPDVEIGCVICGGVIKVRPYMVGRQKYCSDDCRKVNIRNLMRAYRKTERGKAATVEMNNRYKVEDKRRECRICGEEFWLARKRNYCDKCKAVKNG